MILPFAISLLSWLSPFCLIKSVSVAGLVIRYVAVFCHLIPELLGNAALKDNGDGMQSSSLPKTSALRTTKKSFLSMPRFVSEPFPCGTYRGISPIGLLGRSAPARIHLAGALFCFGCRESCVRQRARRRPQTRHDRRGTVCAPETIPPTLRRGAAWRSGALRGFAREPLAVSIFSQNPKIRRFVQ